MAKFTVRVELHDASWDDYNLLYQKLAIEGFTDVISDGKGNEYKMPPAEYNFEGNVTKSEVLKKATNCAKQVVKKYGVLVTESNGRTWDGLPIVK